MRVRLTRKLAEAIDGVDLSRRHVGDVMDLPEHDADMLMAEGWATSSESASERGGHQEGRPRQETEASEVSPRRKR
jgi:hypothetical protein